jgi:D-alanyl-D-alanine carboxypeptidase
VLCLGAIVAGLFFTSNAADARHHRYVRARAAHHVVHHASRSHRRVHHAEKYTPPTASIIVDGNTGNVLHTSNADALRHPASLTKIMTLYLLFERLDAGKIKLDTPLKISAHATEQAPTKLGLKIGQTVAVEDAIKAVVTKSANDIAVAIAENLAGDEDEFCRMMTRKARELGMSHTTYVNASGLPDDDQITTARDQALLGRAIEDRFPRYYKYFSTQEFVYHGEAIRNHNHLLGAVGGVDGIKTGYTRASGFNLVTSVHRDGRYIIGVVLGGRSAFERDAHMRELINDHIKEASLRRTTPVVAVKGESGSERSPAAPTAPARASVASHADPTPTVKVGTQAAVGSNDPIQPLLVKTISYRIAPVQTAALAPMPALVPVAAAAAAPTRVPAAVEPLARVHPPAQEPDPPQTIEVTTAEPAPTVVPAPATAKQSKSEPIKAEPIKAEPIKAEPIKAERVKAEPVKAEPVKAEPVKAERVKAEPVKAEPVKAEPVKAEPVKAEPVKAEPVKPEAPKREAKSVIAWPESAKAESPPQARARGGWLIQIGAFEGEDEAKQHLSAAQLKATTALAAADPYTERVQKGDKALYRARFAGFDRNSAEAACRQLKRNDFQCMALKNQEN